MLETLNTLSDGWMLGTALYVVVMLAWVCLDRRNK